MPEIDLPRGKRTIVDDTDADLAQFRWHCNSNGYVVRAVRGDDGRERQHRLHRVIASRMGLKIEGLQVDHEDGNPLNNRRSNLRTATQSQNNMNQRRSRGYSWIERCQKWRGYIRIDGRQECLGYFITEAEARAAFEAARAIHYGEFTPAVYAERKSTGVVGVTRQYESFRACRTKNGRVIYRKCATTLERCVDGFVAWCIENDEPLPEGFFGHYRERRNRAA